MESELIMIKLTNKDQYFKIDKKDFSLVSKYGWYLDGSGHVCSHPHKKENPIKLKDLLLSKKKEYFIKLKNGDKTDLRRENIIYVLKKRQLIQNGDIAFVPLKSSDKMAIIDIIDYDIVSKYNWTLMPNGYVTGATIGQLKHKNMYLHKLILPSPDGMQTDHINCDKLDNRRSNLRIASPSQNSANYPSKSRSRVPFKGIVYREKSESYYVRCRSNHKTYCIGCFKNINDAAQAYDMATFMLNGQFAYLNNPNKIEEYKEKINRIISLKEIKYFFPSVSLRNHKRKRGHIKELSNN